MLKAGKFFLRQILVSLSTDGFNSRIDYTEENSYTKLFRKVLCSCKRYKKSKVEGYRTARRARRTAPER